MYTCDYVNLYFVIFDCTLLGDRRTTTTTTTTAAAAAAAAAISF